jgi:hypothetical protein
MTQNTAQSQKIKNLILWADDNNLPDNIFPRNEKELDYGKTDNE